MKFNILIACEESQAVLSEVLKLGHEDINVVSCDLQPTSGNYPQYHIQGDVIDVMSNFEYDMLIAFPPCTHLAVSGAAWFENKRKTGEQLEGLQFFSKMYDYKCKYKMIENPVNIVGGSYLKKYYPQFAYMRNPTQYVQPYEHGDKARKKTGLWLWNLPKIRPTNIVTPELVEYTKKDGTKTTFSKDFSNFKGLERSVARSKTYPGIARAISTQLVEYAYNEWKEGHNK